MNNIWNFTWSMSWSLSWNIFFWYLPWNVFFGVSFEVWLLLKSPWSFFWSSSWNKTSSGASLEVWHHLGFLLKSQLFPGVTLWIWSFSWRITCISQSDSRDSLEVRSWSFSWIMASGASLKWTSENIFEVWLLEFILKQDYFERFSWSITSRIFLKYDFMGFFWLVISSGISHEPFSLSLSLSLSLWRFSWSDFLLKYDFFWSFSWSMPGVPLEEQIIQEFWS